MSNAQKALEEALTAIATEQARYMLEDLKKPELRTPALYNAITALLKYHKIEVDPVAGAQPGHPVGALAHGLPPAEYDEDEVAGAHRH